MLHCMCNILPLLAPYSWLTNWGCVTFTEVVPLKYHVKKDILIITSNALLLSLLYTYFMVKNNTFPSKVSLLYLFISNINLIYSIYQFHIFISLSGLSSSIAPGFFCSAGSEVSKILFTFGFKMYLGQADHKHKVLNTSLNNHQGAFTYTTCRQALGCIWAHIICSVNTTASWCIPHRTCEI